MLYDQNHHLIKQIDPNKKDSLSVVKIHLIFRNKIKKIQKEENLNDLEKCPLFFIQKDKILYVNIEKKSFVHISDRLFQVAKHLNTMQYSHFEVIYKGFEKFLYPIFLGILSASYSFLKYKKDNNKQKKTKEFFFEKIPTSTFKKANIINSNLFLIRDLINTPPNIATPEYLSNLAIQEAKKNGLGYSILEGDKLEKERVYGFLAIARGSSHEGKIIHLTYKPKNPKKRIVFVGKGVTYDSGGLSLKSPNSLCSMKSDKGGGATVLGIILAISQLKIPIEVHGIIGALENMVSENACKLGDIVFTREGKTVEIKNTDAEGRIVLAECLSYAQDLRPDFLIDLATLTGSCVAGLGEYTFGVMGNNKKLNRKFIKCAEKSGELASELPFNEFLEATLQSHFADISNIGAQSGDAIIAGLFLNNFIRKEYKKKWLHIDMAGPVFVDCEWSINPPGASGCCLRTCVDFCLDLVN